MDPTQIAKRLMSQYVNDPHCSVSSVDLAINQFDNEMVTQILLVIYNECFKDYFTKVDTPSFATALNKCFTSLGYQMKLVKLDSLDDQCYYVKIKSDMSMVRSPYHPFSIREYMIRENRLVPDAFSDFFYNPVKLEKIVNIHEHETFLYTIQFKKLS